MTRRFDVRLTTLAEQDIESTHDYLCEHGSPAIAADLLDRFLSRIDSLAQFPRRGAIVAEVGTATDDVRQFVIGVYRGIYVIADDVVLILAVFDGRRNVLSLIEQRLLRELK